MAKIIVSFKNHKSPAIKENKEQLDELLPGPAIITHAYKWLAPLHDMINMADPKTKGIFKSLFEWYQNNDTVQTLGKALTNFEDTMNNMWKSGKIGKSNAIALQSMIGLGDIAGASAWSTVGAFMSAMRDAMEKEKFEIAQRAAAAIEKAQEEASAKAKIPKLEAIIDKLKADIRQKDFERAKQLFDMAKKLDQERIDMAKKLDQERKKTDDEKGERIAPISSPDQHINEDKKMAKKYSSFKQQQTLTENFRRFMGEIRVEDQLGTSTNRLTITNKEDILAAIKEYYPDGISQHAEVIVDFTGLNNEAIWQELREKGIVAHLSREIPNEKDSRIIQSEIQNWINDRGLTTDGEIDYGQFQESKKAKKVTKSQLTKIIAEEIKKTLSEAEEIPPKPDWMSQERYDQLVAPEKAKRAKEDEESAAAGLAKAEELEQEFLNDPKIADLGLGAKTKVNAGGLWVGLPSRSKPGKVSTDGANTADELHSKLIYSDWHPTRKFDKKGWVKVVKRRKEKP